MTQNQNPSNNVAQTSVTFPLPTSGDDLIFTETNGGYWSLQTPSMPVSVSNIEIVSEDAILKFTLENGTVVEVDLVDLLRDRILAVMKELSK